MAPSFPGRPTGVAGVSGVNGPSGPPVNPRSYQPRLTRISLGRTSTFFSAHARLSISDVTIPRQPQTLALASANPRARNLALARSNPNPASRYAGPGRVQRPLGRAGVARRARRGRACWPGWLLRLGGRSGCGGRQLVSGCSSAAGVVADGGWILGRVRACGKGRCGGESHSGWRTWGTDQLCVLGCKVCWSNRGVVWSACWDLVCGVIGMLGCGVSYQRGTPVGGHAAS